jgi:hypothetical protein
MQVLKEWSGTTSCGSRADISLSSIRWCKTPKRAQKINNKAAHPFGTPMSHLRMAETIWHPAVAVL